MAHFTAITTPPTNVMKLEIKSDQDLELFDRIIQNTYPSNYYLAKIPKNLIPSAKVKLRRYAGVMFVEDCQSTYIQRYICDRFNDNHHISKILMITESKYNFCVTLLPDANIVVKFNGTGNKLLFELK